MSRGGDGSGQGSRYKKLPSCLRMDSDPGLCWDFVGELGDGAFGKVYKVCDLCETSNLYLNPDMVLY